MFAQVARNWHRRFSLKIAAPASALSVHSGKKLKILDWVITVIILKVNDTV